MGAVADILSIGFEGDPSTNLFTFAYPGPGRTGSRLSGVLKVSLKYSIT